MAFDWQVALGTALVGVGEKTGQMYDDYKNEQLEIRQEDRRYQTEMRKEQEKHNLGLQREAAARKQRAENLPEGIDPDSFEGRSWIETGTLVRKPLSTEEKVAEQRTLLEAESDFNTEQKQAEFQADLQRNGNPAPGTEKYLLIQNKHYGEIPLTVEEQAMKLEQGASVMVQQFYPELEPGTPAFQKKVRKLAKIEGETKAMSPEQQRLWKKDAADDADRRIKTAVENGTDNELIAKHGSLEKARQEFMIDYLADGPGGSIGRAGGDTASQEDFKKIAGAHPNVQKAFFETVEKREGSEARKKAEAAVGKISKRNEGISMAEQEETALQGFEKPAKPKREPTPILETPSGRKLTWGSIWDFMKGPDPMARSWNERKPE